MALFHQFLPGHEVRIAAEQNIGSTACHVGGDSHHAEAACLRHDLGFALVELGVEHHVAHALSLQNSRETFRLFDGRSTDQHRLLLLVKDRDVVGYCFVLFFLGAEDHVGIFKPAHQHVSGDDHNLELVNLFEFGCFGFRCARHATQLFVEAEVVLERNRGQRLVFLADVDAFLGLDGLVQTVGPAAPRHQAAGEGVDDDDFAILDHVLYVALVKRMRLDRGFNIVLEFPVFSIGDVIDTQQLFNRDPAIVRHADGALLLIHNVVAIEKLLALGKLNAKFLLALVVVVFDLFAHHQLRNDLARTRILVRSLVGGAGDDERSTCLVDEDRVHFVDDGIVVAALHAILDLKLHVVAQVVEAKLVICPIGDVGRVGGSPLIVVEVVDDYADRETEELVYFAHPLGVALGQIIVHRDHMHSVSGERVEIAAEGRHQRFALTGFHLGDLALVQHHGADQLHVKVAHLHGTPAGLAHHRKCFRKQTFQRFLFGCFTCVLVRDSIELGCNSGPELNCLVA